ncbi:MAG: ABC transporter ATP-binding protein/permease [Actinomycetota bacterium]|nr:ABC transporter ATP-binding protein [Acidimicrobiia bacterium]MDQ3293941.1 ABC transporter ATP-binding protein/permease [Actinomycetota bacterium]
MSSPLTDDLPPGRQAMWRSLKLGWRAEPLLLVLAFATTVGAAIPDALFAIGLSVLAGAVEDSDRSAMVVAALVLGVLATLSWLLKTIGERANRRFADRSTVTIEAHVAHLQASVGGIEHHERPDHLDRLAVLRDQVFTLNHIYMSLFSTAGAVLRLVLTIALLASVHPALVLLAVAAVPTVVASGWASKVERRVQEAGASHNRLARHLFTLATTAAPGKEVRVAQVEARLRVDRRAAWDRWYRPLSRARWRSATVQSATWAIFGLAYVGSVVFVARGADASAGDVLLVLAAGSRLSSYVGQAATEANFLQGFWLDAARKLAWLEDYAAANRERADRPVPERITDAIRFESVSFSYPGTDRLVLDDVDLTLPAGSVVAVVGENGAGKSTLVKLLCRFYEPTAGTITVDGVDLGRFPAEAWRDRLAGAFQDFFRFELAAGHSVGVGDLPRIEERPAVETAVVRGGAGDVVERLVQGLDTQLGPTWPDGVEMSFGQWQKVALARGFMRDRPLLLVLDEPTAALDAETEHALFERFAAAAQAPDGVGDGRITVLVSHRFSTVRMADRIIVLDGAKVIEHGTHDELMAHDGRYAELYGIQAAAYR